MTTERSELDALRASVKREVRQQAATWLVALVVGAAVLAGSGWWLYLKPRLVQIAGGVPSGLVAAFDLPKDCPTGWTTFAEGSGRTIIGVGKGSDLTDRRYREEGGTEAHVLTVAQLPSHDHEVIQMIRDDEVDGVDSTTTESGDHHNQSRRSSQTGSGEAHNNMPPFIALHYCKKR